MDAPAPAITWRARVAGLLYRLLELALVLVGIVWLVAPVEDPSADVGFLGGWVGLAALYLIVRWRGLHKGAGGSPEDWRRQAPGRRLGATLNVVGSLVGIGASLNLVLVGRNQPVEAASHWLWVPAVIFSWLLLHLGYAAVYARWYYEKDRGSLRFPATETPSMVDFTYFALTLGTSVAVSDVEVRSSALRYRVLVHTVLGFFFNTALLAIAIGAVTRG